MGEIDGHCPREFEVYGIPPVGDPSPLAPDVIAAETARQAARDRVIELASHIHAAEAELAGLVAELDASEAWHGPGYVSLGHWLGVNAGFTPAEAARRVRVAARAGELPALSTAAAEGRISAGLMDRACRIATPDTDAALAEVCSLVSPAQAMRTMAAKRDVEAANDPDPEPADPEVERTWLRTWWDDAHRLHIDGCLSALDGALFDTAIDAAKAAGERDAAHAHRVTGPEALTRMSELMLDDARHEGLSRDGTNFTVELTLDADTGAARFGDVDLNDHEIAEACCDSRLHHLIHHSGVALAMGRDLRTVNRALRRALRLRDGGCAFPGCGQTRFVHAHHIVFWEHGGPTDLDNLVLLCTRHHRLLHAGDYGCEMGDDRKPRFCDPNGSPVVARHGPPDVVGSLRAWHRRQREREIDPTAARARSGGQPLTRWALDLLVERLVTAAPAA